MKPTPASPPHASHLRLLALLGLLSLVACTEKPREPSPPLADVCAQASSGREVTFYRDVKPLIDTKCGGCHQQGGIAPFPLTEAAQVQGMKNAILHSVCERTMPPWPPHQACNQYNNDRSLSDEQIALLRDWVYSGAPLGNASDAPAEAPTQDRLSRVDLELAMKEPYTPRLGPDEYRCFLLDWPETEEKFITGLGVRPGRTEIVHHVLAAVVPPEAVDFYTQADEADPGPGYACPGGPTIPNGPKGSRVLSLMGGWGPGSEGTDMPGGTGIRVRPGSRLVMQLHYNTSSAPAVPDVSKMLLKLDGAVEHEAYVFPFTDPRWSQKKEMDIPLGETDVFHIFSYDALTVANRASKQKIRDNAPITVYGAGLHMHKRGTRTVLTVKKSGEEKACLLEIPEWDFHWQGVYQLRQPVRVSPGDDLRIECHWNNAGFTPHHGEPVTSVPGLNWGEGTDDEMCIAFLYVTQE